MREHDRAAISLRWAMKKSSHGRLGVVIDEGFYHRDLIAFARPTKSQSPIAAEKPQRGTVPTNSTR
jgi:hypothetical protein